MLARITRRPGTLYVALVPNLKGAERALAAGADELNLVMSASETHNRANMGLTREASLDGFARIVAAAPRHGRATQRDGGDRLRLPLRGRPAAGAGPRASSSATAPSGSTASRWPTPPAWRTRARSATSSARALRLVPAEALTLHFHNTRGLGLANVLAARAAGARRFDAALGGLGGCPFAPGATGNICTEDLVSMAHEMGIPTGLDLDGLIALSRGLPALVGHPVPGQVAQAGRPGDLHPPPPGIAA